MEANNNLPTLAASNLTAEQQHVISDMQEYAKLLQNKATITVDRWVVAGYATGSTEPIDYYCYCGIGKGYQGAPLVPANSNAVVFAAKEAAERKAQLLKYTNGHGQRIMLKAVPANEYFWQLHDDVCRTMYNIQQVINNK